MGGRCLMLRANSTQMCCLQELKVPRISLPFFHADARRLGWNVVAVEAYSGLARQLRAGAA
eukprot:10634220-Alexandrium_andersonii.AAC.1